MKKIILISGYYYCMIILIFLFTRCNSNGDVKNKPNAKIIIDTIFNAVKNDSSICFRLDESTYPKITGAEDTAFQETINNLFQKNFISFVDSSKFSCNCDLKEGYMGNFPSASSNFEVLYNKNGIMSILQRNVQLPGGMGNAWLPSFTLSTVDFQNKLIMGNQQLHISERNITEINSQIVKYFDKQYPTEKGNMNYPVLNTNNLKDAKFGIKNDSITLVTVAYPGAHYTHSIYSIPIMKW